MPFILRQRKDSSIIHSPSNDRLGFGTLRESGKGAEQGQDTDFP